jgi:predicted dehydrogenase
LFNFGILGTGRIAAKFCSTFKQGLISNGCILAAASKDLNRAKEFAAANEINRFYGSYKELLEDKEINIVYIALTNEMHFPCCKMAIQSGKHIICEKPMTTNAADARTLAALAKDTGVFLMEAMWTRFLPAIQKAEEWVLNGRIGELCGIKASLCASRNAAEYPRLFDPAKGGGALLDLGIYGLHLARHFAGNRSLLECKSVSVPDPCGVDISNYTLLEYAGGFIADISCSIGFSAPNDAYILGKTGYIRIAHWFSAARDIELFTLPFAGPGNNAEFYPTDKFSATPGFEFEILHAMECIRQGKIQSDIVPLADTIEAMEIIDKINPPVP